MDRNFYRENIGDAEMSSQVASWARNWAETFRREAWQQDMADTAIKSLISEPKNIAPKRPVVP